MNQFLPFFHGQKSLWLLWPVLAFLAPATHAQAQGPGGINANVRLWLRANSGFTPTQWSNQSGNSFHYTQANVPAQPAAIAAFGMYNFNPAVNFQGNKFMTNTGAVLPTGNSNSLPEIETISLTPKSSNGLIPGAIHFSTKRGTTDHQRIESYLAVRHCITLANHYLANDGSTTIYSTDTYDLSAVSSVASTYSVTIFHEQTDQLL